MNKTKKEKELNVPEENNDLEKENKDFNIKKNNDLNYEKYIKKINCGYYIKPQNKNTTFHQEFNETIIILIMLECLKSGIVGYNRKIIKDEDQIQKQIDLIIENNNKKNENQLYLHHYNPYFIFEINKNNMNLILDSYSLEEYIYQNDEFVIEKAIKIDICKKTKIYPSIISRMLDFENIEDINKNLTNENKIKIITMFLKNILIKNNKEFYFNTENTIMNLNILKSRMNIIRYIDYKQKNIKAKLINEKTNLLEIYELILEDIGVKILINRYLNN